MEGKEKKLTVVFFHILVLPMTFPVRLYGGTTFLLKLYFLEIEYEKNLFIFSIISIIMGDRCNDKNMIIYRKGKHTNKKLLSNGQEN